METTDLQVLKNQLYWCFRGAYNGKLSIEKLYKKGLKIKENIEELFPDFLKEKSESSRLTKEALGFIEQLHDSESREFIARHKESIYYQVIMLNSQRFI